MRTKIIVCLFALAAGVTAVPDINSIPPASASLGVQCNSCFAKCLGDIFKKPSSGNNRWQPAIEELPDDARRSVLHSPPLENDKIIRGLPQPQNDSKTSDGPTHPPSEEDITTFPPPTANDYDVPEENELTVQSRARADLTHLLKSYYSEFNPDIADRFKTKYEIKTYHTVQCVINCVFKACLSFI